jgi:hypothetical protein
MEKILIVTCFHGKLMNLRVMAENKETTTWPELAISLYDALTGRGAKIHYDFDNLEVHVPSKASSDAVQAPWKLNGRMTVHTEEKS